MSVVYRPVNADQYVSGNYGFLRIKQALASAGDIFESAQGAHSFCMGPDSDVSLATIAYFDQFSQPTYSAQASPAPTNMNTLTISPQRAWVNPIPAVNKEGQYAPAGTPGRILIWPTELYDSTFRPPSFDPVADGLVFEPPVIDIIQSFGPTPTPIAQRSDKTYYYDQLPVGSSGFSYVMIPFYGRRYASVWFQRTGGLGNQTVTVRGINFRITTAYNGMAAIQSVSGTIISPQTIVVEPNFYDSEQAFVAGTNQAGLWDYLMVEVEASAPGINGALRVVVSDVAA